MPQSKYNDFAHSGETQESNISNSTYTEFLSQYGVQFEETTYYLRVGKVKHVQGWIIDISVILSEVEFLIKTLLPDLIKLNICFQIPKNKDKVKQLLDGSAGYSKLGKIIGIFPENESTALNIVERLLVITSNFSGPSIPSNKHLGGSVYVRYGACNPVMLLTEQGKSEKYIYDTKGNLIKDPVSIPFSLPKDINWPFITICGPSETKSSKYIKNNTYRIISTIKADVKGNVYKAIYIKGLLNVTKCIIKEGKYKMASDEDGRNMQHRLTWQQQVHNDLSPAIRLPKIYDFFNEGKDFYLVLEYIKGETLFDRVIKSYNDCKPWFQKQNSEKIQLVQFVLQLCEILSLIHSNGYVHRDVTSTNFIVDDDKRLRPIDVELSYSLKKCMPNPPFATGTPGFTSQEQVAISIPTIKEDIFGLGAVMLEVFTGQSPKRFLNQSAKILFKTVYFYTQSNKLATLVERCMSQKPFDRPELTAVIFALRDFMNDQTLNDKLGKTEPPNYINISPYFLQHTINETIESICKPPFVHSNNLWITKLQSNKSPFFTETISYGIVPNLYDGLAGILYCLANAKRQGFQIPNNIPTIYDALETIKWAVKNAHISTALYNGSGGIAIAIVAAIKGGWLNNNAENKELIHNCFATFPDEISIENGISGQGMALFQCKHFLDKGFINERLKQHKDRLIQLQKKDGSWNTGTVNGKTHKLLGVTHGIAGILLFLIEYWKSYPDESTIKSISKGLRYLTVQTKKLKDLTNESYWKVIDAKKTEFDSGVGIILVFIMAFETLKNPEYKLMVNNALSNFPPYMVHPDLSQATGLTSLGEVYLEAYRVLKDNEWHQRAVWIAQVILHTLQKDRDGNTFWSFGSGDFPSASFMTGNSGIIYYLMRITGPNKLGYRLIF